MRISGLNGMGAGMPINMQSGSDPRSKEIQKKIQEKQDELRKLFISPIFIAFMWYNIKTLSKQ